ncbi:Phytochrome-like protein cph1 [Cesiribacter andamanensis AMV16]|uniref:histidine kinase n=1 Tax=Cesiribacter andamanensis AMV16 TaxID=1279009 RepID=M7NTL4_9BACT|nr:Phytochrome-like protein cph1 [Cesiribacter andamanensis AMV16]
MLPQLSLGEPGADDHWQLGKVMQSKKLCLLSQPSWPEQHPVAGLEHKGGPTAAVIPILKPGEDRLIGFFVSGISPWLEYDGEYQNFHQLLTGQIASSLASLQARAEAARQQEELINLFEQAPVAIGILGGANFVVELANPGICEIWRKSHEEVINRPVFDALPEVRGQGLEELLEEVYTRGVSHSFSEYPVTFMRKGLPQDAWLNFMYYPFRNSQGVITGVIVIAVEVTEQVRARQLIERTNNELMATNADLDNFVYSASHDLKAPILNIEGLMNMLLPITAAGNMTAPESDRVVGMIFSSINRLKTTIADLSEVSRVQKEAHEDVREVALADVVADVRSDMELHIREAGAEIITDLQQCSLRFSPKNLRSIVYNLLSNAIKYHSPQRRPRVELNCRMEDDFLVFSVTDNGLGIDLQHEDKIFSMFKRMHTHVEGSGVGLYIIKRIVENAGGSIRVESTVGEGSTFTIYLKKQ